MADLLFKALSRAGVTTNPNVGFFCALVLYLLLFFLCASYVSVYGIKGVLRILETTVLVLARLVLEVLIFAYILFSYKHKNFFEKYNKRRKRALKKLAQR